MSQRLIDAEPWTPQKCLCRLCRRPLRNPTSVQIGIGPVCLRKEQAADAEDMEERLELRRLATTEVPDPDSFAPHPLDERPDEWDEETWARRPTRAAVAS